MEGTQIRYHMFPKHLHCRPTTGCLRCPSTASIFMSSHHSGIPKQLPLITFKHSNTTCCLAAEIPEFPQIRISMQPHSFSNSRNLQCLSINRQHFIFKSSLKTTSRLDGLFWEVPQQVLHHCFARDATSTYDHVLHCFRSTDFLTKLIGTLLNKIYTRCTLPASRNSILSAESTSHHQIDVSARNRSSSPKSTCAANLWLCTIAECPWSLHIGQLPSFHLKNGYSVRLRVFAFHYNFFVHNILIFTPNSSVNLFNCRVPMRKLPCTLTFPTADWSFPQKLSLVRHHKSFFNFDIDVFWSKISGGLRIQLLQSLKIPLWNSPTL